MFSSLRKKLCFISFILLVTLVGCSGNTPDNSSTYEKQNKNSHISVRFAIMLVKGVNTQDAIKSKIEDLQLETQPILTDKDLISYKWKEHELEFRPELDLNKSLGKVPLDGVPFVVIVNDKRAYLGTFWSPLSSLAPNIPTVMIWPSLQTNGNTVRIQAGFSSDKNNQSDPRSNQLIYEALKSMGKIKE